MSGIKYREPFSTDTNALLTHVVVFTVIIITLVISLGKPNETESNEIPLIGMPVNVSKKFSNALFQSEKKKINVSNKLICFYIFTKKFNPKIMDGLCTHINIGFFMINVNTNEFEASNDQLEILPKILLLKEKSKNLKIITSIGGAGVTTFSSMVSNHTTRKKFIKSCMDFLKEYKLDGIDLDWEWPVVSDGSTKEKIQFVQLLSEIKKEFNRHKKKYILSVDVPSTRYLTELGFLVNYIADVVDYVSVMCYDYHYYSKLFPFTGHNAPLYSNTRSFLPTFDVNQSIRFWISKSMPREKIVLGMPTYGHTFKLRYSQFHSLYAPAKGFGSMGINGFVEYRNVCSFLNLEKTTVVFDNVSKVPYAYHLSEWISFDNEKSLALKASYILEEGLAGAMVFAVNTDDYDGSCRELQEPLPLIKKIQNILLDSP